MEWYLPSEKPASTVSTGLTDIIFCDNARYYIGKTGPDGKWYEYHTETVLDAVNAWAFLPESPLQITNAIVVEDWLPGNGPVSNAFSHFLLYDNEEIEYANINSTFFDSQNRTFKEVTHHLVLPNVPLRLFTKAAIVKQMQGFLKEILLKPALKSLKLNAYLETCLYIAVKEMINTTTNGVRRNYLVQGDAYLKEVVNRWAFQVNNGLNKAAGKDYIRQPLGTVLAPADTKAQKEITDILELVTKNV